MFLYTFILKQISSSKAVSPLAIFVRLVMRSRLLIGQFYYTFFIRTLNF